METQLSILVLAFVGFVLSVSAILGESQSILDKLEALKDEGLNVSPPPPPPPPLRSPPPPPHSSTPTFKRRPPPPASRFHKNSQSNHHKRPPPPRRKEALNMGKKIGLLFAGVAAILQIGVAGFLVYKRRQLLKA